MEAEPAGWRSVLRSFTEEGSFVLKLRVDLKWDEVAFERLTRALVQACREADGNEQRERWLCEVFWWCGTWPKHWTDHPTWRDHPLREEIDAGTGLLWDIADRFFSGPSDDTYTGPPLPDPYFYRDNP